LLFELTLVSNLFPTAGFQIIIEPSSPEDPPCLEGDYSTDPL